jgi:hypothetical protein
MLAVMVFAMVIGRLAVKWQLAAALGLAALAVSSFAVQWPYWPNPGGHVQHRDTASGGDPASDGQSREKLRAALADRAATPAPQQQPACSDAPGGEPHQSGCGPTAFATPLSLAVAVDYVAQTYDAASLGAALAKPAVAETTAAAEPPAPATLPLRAEAAPPAAAAGAPVRVHGVVPPVASVLPNLEFPSSSSIPPVSILAAEPAQPETGNAPAGSSKAAKQPPPAH